MEIEGGDKMLGLEKEIIARKTGKKSNPEERYSVAFIGRLLEKPYQTIRKKLKRKSFSIEEQWAIFKSIVPHEKQTMELLEYLFTEQD